MTLRYTLAYVRHTLGDSVTVDQWQTMCAALVDNLVMQARVENGCTVVAWLVQVIQMIQDEGLVWRGLGN